MRGSFNAVKEKLCSEQGATVSQVAAATFLDTVSRLLRHGKKANVAVSAHTQVHMSDPPDGLIIGIECAHKNGHGYHLRED